MTRCIALALIASALVAGCGREKRHDYEAAANQIANEQRNPPHCYDCDPYEFGNGVTASPS